MFVLAGLALAAVPLAPRIVVHPARTILPVYAASIPAGSVIRLSIPLPPPFNTLSSLLGALVIVAILAHIGVYRRARVPTFPVALWLLLLGWVTLTAFWAIASDPAVDALLVAWPLVLLLLAVSVLPTDESDLDAMRLGVIVGGIGVGAYLVFLLAVGNPLVSVDERFAIAVGAVENDPNILAASLIVSLAVSLERLVLGGRRWLSPTAWRSLAGFGVTLVVVAIASTGSRGGLMAAAVTVVLVLIASARTPVARRYVRRTAFSMLMLVLGLSAFTAISVRVAPQGTVARIVNNPPLDRIHATELGGSGRSEIWATAVQLCRVYCGHGSGQGTFVVAFNETFAFSGALNDIGPNRPAHSIFLEIAVETGFVGLTLLIFAIVAEWRLLARRAIVEAAPSLKGAFIAVIIANVFLSTLWFKYFWLLPVMARLAEGAVQRRAEEPIAPAPMPEPVAERA